MSGQCVLASLIIYNRLVTSENQQSSTRELKRLSINITALQDTRLPSNGSLRKQDYTFFWQEKEPDEFKTA